jgi:hypothetical protein
MEKLRKKKSMLLSSLAFMLRCRDQHVIPTFMKVKHHTNTKPTRRILQRTSIALIRERIHCKRRELNKVSRELYLLHLRLSRGLTHHVWDVIDHFMAAQAYWTSVSTTATQKQKFSRLQGTQQPSKRMEPEKFVVNHTNRHLDPAAVSILSKGLN